MRPRRFHDSLGTFRSASRYGRPCDPSRRAATPVCRLHPVSEPPPSPGSDWATQAIDSLESIITAIKAKTSDPLVKLAHTVVYALAGVGLVFATLLLFTMAAVHFWSGHWHVWVLYMGLGGMFFLGGLFLRTFRAPRRS